MPVVFLSAPASAESVVVFNEIQYHPALPDDLEWIELHNQMSYDVDLSDWELSGGVDFSFPKGTVISAGGYLLISGDLTNPPAAGALGPWSGSLSNKDARLKLRNNSGRLMNEIQYADSGVWPIGADGSGAALAKSDEATASEEAANWRASAKLGGTPGAENFPAGSEIGPPLVISEIAGTGDAVFQIEIANTSAIELEVGDYFLQSQGAVIGSYSIPGATKIPGNGFLVIDMAELGFRPGNDDRLFLISPSGSLVHAVRADDLPRAYSSGHEGRMLVPDVLTFGSPNIFDINSDIVINEIMYHFRDDPGTPGIAPSVNPVALIEFGGNWRYNESGAELGLGWQTTAHPVGVADWSEGPGLLGSETSPDALPEPLRTTFAPSSGNVIMTYYFEKEFEVTANELTNLVSLQLEHLIDDGAVFYLNGIEVSRFNLPAGPVTAATPASPGVPNARYEGPFELSTGNLLVGSNRLSVEVHQQSPTSSDIVFGASLTALTQTDPGVASQPIVERGEEWVELYNKGDVAVDLDGWSFDGGIDFDFPTGTVIAAGDYLVVAKDATALIGIHPGIAGRIVGNFESQLGNSGDYFRLEDAVENPVDEVRYFDGGSWPEVADGGGSSLELRDPEADNTNPQAWAASVETGKSRWQTVSYRDDGAQSYGLTNWHEFRLGMLGAGELLIDDVSVVRDPDGAAQQLIQNGNFTSGDDTWRFLGNHRHSTVIAEPGNGGNHVLHLIAKGATDTRHNHLETTFLNNTRLVSGQIYEVSFRARWLRGSNAINSRCYYQRAALTTQLERPEACGTPGAANSTLESNIGPTFRRLRHDPPVPAADEMIEIFAEVADPDGLGDFALKARIDEGSVQTYPFTVNAEGRGMGSIPGQPGGTVIQFWVEGLDLAAARSFAPAAGPDSRALIQVNDGQGTNLEVTEVRLVMLGSDLDFMLGNLNLMSNERLGGTAILDRREITYDAAVRLRGSGAGRARDGAAFRGFNIGLPADQKYRGVHDSLSIDRSARTPTTRQQHEIYVKHMFNHAGIPCMYDELVYLVGPSRTYTGTSQMLMASYGGHFTETQFEDGEDGTVFNLDITYDPTSSIGGVEGLKPPVPFTHVGTDIRNLGDSEEDYRTAFEIRTGRARDDYSGLINFAKTMDLPTVELAERIGEVMDVDEWCRYTALTLLCGIGDSFVNGGLPHNIRMYVPADGRGVTALPWDMDFVFSSGTNSSMLPGAPNLRRVIAIPKYRRLYLGHVQDLIQTTFNGSYMAPWLAHYGGVVGQSFGGGVSYINARGNFALSQLGAEVPFSVTTNAGNDFSVAATSAVLEGKGWIDIREFRLADRDGALAAEWLDVDTWRVTVPLLSGKNAITLETFDFQGELLNSKRLTITNTVTTPTPPEFLRITEIHYHPAPPATAAELLASDDFEDFEFIELQNIGSEALNVGGVQFSEGLDFTFPGGTIVPAGGYLVLAHNEAAFAARYSDGIPVAGEFATSGLRNSGELLELRDASGNIIQQFIYGDESWFAETDGAGFSLHIKNARVADLASWGNPESWAVSGNLHGNPGVSNSPTGVSFQSWLEQHFSEAERNDPLVSGPRVDLNGDGFTNLLKYAFGLDPYAYYSLNAVATAASVEGKFQFSFRRQAGADDLEFLPQSSGDLVDWEALTRQTGVLDNGDGTETVTVQDDGPSSQKFGRVLVRFSRP